MLSIIPLPLQIAIFAFILTVNSLVYYGLYLMSTDLSGDRNISLVLSGLVEVTRLEDAHCVKN